MEEKSYYIDFVKGWSITLVIIGHSLQFGMNGNMILSDPLFKMIYSFHMPIFMLVSGYLFNYTVQHYNTKELFINRIRRLLIPIMTWNAAYYCLHCIYHIKNLDLRFEVLDYLKSNFYTSWFLWAILWSSLIIIIVNRYFDDNFVVYMVLYIILFLIPDYRNFELYKFMYPYFVAGYMYCKKIRKLDKKIRVENNSWQLYLLGGVWLLLLAFFKEETYIYVSKYTILKSGMISGKQLLIDLYRMVIGFCGSAFWLEILKIFENKSNILKKILVCLGRNSLGIYLASGYIFTYFNKIAYTWDKNYILMVIESVVILVITYYMTNIMKKIKWTNYLLLGARK